MGRLVITQKGRDLLRVASTIGAYTILGLGTLAVVVVILSGTAAAYEWVN